MTPTRKNNPTYNRFANTASTEDESMGQQRTNRKRTRHRPRSRGRRSGEVLRPSPIQPAPISAHVPTAMSVRYSYNGCDSCLHAAGTSTMGRKTHPAQVWQSPRKREDLWEREKRIFGGSGDERDGEDLKAPMLDVVLGLFDGLDYDDDDACC